VPVVPPVAEAVPARADGKAKVEVGNLDWPALARQVAECRACALCEQRKQAVLGVGDTNPDWLFIGEGPGSEEDAKGEPLSARPASCSTTCWRRSTSPAATGSISPMQ
jgi:DNA polymerase